MSNSAALLLSLSVGIGATPFPRYASTSTSHYWNPFDSISSKDSGFALVSPTEPHSQLSRDASFPTKSTFHYAFLTVRNFVCEFCDVHIDNFQLVPSRDKPFLNFWVYLIFYRLISFFNGTFIPAIFKARHTLTSPPICRRTTSLFSTDNSSPFS